MPKISAPSVTGGPARVRRSHRFAADKDDTMLTAAVHATLVIDANGSALFLMTNDRVGHAFPSGGNGVSVRLEARDDAGQTVATHEEPMYYRKERLVFDIWPFRHDTRLRPGEQAEARLALPAGHGVVTATVSYHDWMKSRRPIATFETRY